MGVQAVVLEKDFLRTILDCARLHGWTSAHFGSTVKLVRRGGAAIPIPDKGAAGFPDLVLVRPPRILFAEVKVRQPLSAEQAEWMRLLLACGCEAYVWRPSDWPEIEGRLA